VKNLKNNSTRYLIRFRAWNRDDKTLYKWDMFEGYPPVGVNATCPQEHTGAYDKNSKKIFIGDIVHYLNENYLASFYCGSYVLRKLENCTGSDNFIWFHDIFEKFNETEVVGNTFENADYITECLKNNFMEHSDSLSTGKL